VNNDKKEELALLEELILNKFVASGYIVGVGDWGFKVEIDSQYKNKNLSVIFRDEKGIRPIFTSFSENIEGMYSGAFKFFKEKEFRKGQF